MREVVEPKKFIVDLAFDAMKEAGVTPLVYLNAPSWSPPHFQFWQEKLMLEIGGIRFGESDRIKTRIHSDAESAVL